MNSILLISYFTKYAVAIVLSTSGTSTSGTSSSSSFGTGYKGISGSNEAFEYNGFTIDDTFHADLVDCPTDINYNRADDLSDDKHQLFKYQGGWLVPNVSFYPIFWSLPKKPVNKKDQLQMFYQDLVGSSFMTALADDFSVPGQKIGTGSYLGSFTYVTKKTTFTDGDIRAKLAEWVASGTLPSPNRNTYFSIHFGPGINVLKDGSDSINNQCSQWCAYHGAIDVRCAATGPKTVIQYGVAIDTSSRTCQNQCVGMEPKPFNTCPQWNDINFDIQTILSSHEIAEMVTNPLNNKGWFNPQDRKENADYCKSISFFVSPKPRFNTTLFSGCRNRDLTTPITPSEQRPRYAVQQFFSPKQGKCVASTANISPLEEDVKNTYCNKTTIGATSYSNIQISYIPIDNALFFTCPPKVRSASIGI